MSARSSDSIRHIAKALAAAQRELQNPQPRHEGQIRRELPSGLALIEPYRFASLGDGLALIRPVLGRHGISLIQATRLDSATGLVVLETRLIHESGEWILADYPVGGVPQVGASDPRELGAALTYARRQSLFALIGIAPQSDTDGTFRAGNPADAGDASPPTASPDRNDAPTGAPLCSSERGRADDRATVKGAQQAVEVSARFLPSDPSRSSEDTLRILSRELAGLSCPDQLRNWAIDRIKVMASLLPQDRRRLNGAFVAKRNSVGEQSARDSDRGDQHADEASQLTAATAPAAKSEEKRNAPSGSRRKTKTPARSKPSSWDASAAAAAATAAGGLNP